MSSNIQFRKEASGDIPDASSSDNLRLYLDSTDSQLKLKDNLGASYNITGVQGFKEPVRVATVVALPSYTRITNTITGNAIGALPAQDGVILSQDDSLLLLTGTSAADNGLWVVAQTGSGLDPFVLERREDLAASIQALPGLVVTTGPEGSTYGSSAWLLSTPLPIVLNSTSLNFTRIGEFAEPIGTAGGDLSGSYPNPEVSAIHSGATQLTVGSVADYQYVARSGTSLVGTTSLPVYRQTTEPSLSFDDQTAIWVDTDGSDRTYLVFRRGVGNQLKIELL